MFRRGGAAPGGRLPAAEPVEQAALPLGRAARPARPGHRGRHPQRLGGRRRREVLEKELGPERRAPPLRQGQHLDDLFPAAQGNPKRVPGADQLGGFRRASVDIHLAPVAGGRGEAPAPEEPGSPEPFIQPHSLHGLLLLKPPRKGNSLPRGCGIVAACPPPATRPPAGREATAPHARAVPPAFPPERADSATGSSELGIRKAPGVAQVGALAGQ